MSGQRKVRLSWTGDGLRFVGKGTLPETPEMEIDGDNATSPGPMLTLLLAAASCSSADVVLILQKMRVELRVCEVDVEGVRRDEDPKRYDAVHMHYRLSGEGLDQAKADRAVGLSIEKYCSVIHSLAPDIAFSYDIAVE